MKTNLTREEREARRTKTLSHLRGLQRDPFTEVLANVLAAEPTQERLDAFAHDDPDKWARMVGIFARLSGYADKTEINENVFLHIMEMGDAQLLQRMQELDNVLELDRGEFAEVEADADTPASIDGMKEGLAGEE